MRTLEYRAIEDKVRRMTATIEAYQQREHALTARVRILESALEALRKPLAEFPDNTDAEARQYVADACLVLINETIVGRMS